MNTATDAGSYLPAGYLSRATSTRTHGIDRYFTDVQDAISADRQNAGAEDLSDVFSGRPESRA